MNTLKVAGVCRKILRKIRSLSNFGLQVSMDRKDWERLDEELDEV